MRMNWSYLESYEPQCLSFTIRIRTSDLGLCISISSSVEHHSNVLYRVMNLERRH